MAADSPDAVRAATERVVGLEEELEASGVAHTQAGELDRARAVLHAWVDELVGVVISPGLGRVTLIHADGVRSSIASPDLPFRMSRPVGPAAG